MPRRVVYRFDNQIQPHAQPRICIQLNRIGKPNSRGNSREAGEPSSGVKDASTRPGQLFLPEPVS